MTTTALGLPMFGPRGTAEEAARPRGSGSPFLMDSFGRRAIDLRLSLTDKCNLRCSYCMPAEGLDWLKKNQVLTADENLRIRSLGGEQLGVRDLRLTGGEPLVRADLVAIIAGIRAAHRDLPVSLTTNGVGL